MTMKHIIHPTIKLMAQWPDDKFERFKPYLRRELKGEHYSELINMRTARKQEHQINMAHVNFTLAEWLGYEDNDIDEWS